MTATASSLTYDDLKKLLDGDTVAIRGVATLEPAGGPGDKIFPPTHAVDDKNKKPGAKYAFETRRIGGQDVRCVLIDRYRARRIAWRRHCRRCGPTRRSCSQS